MICKLCGADRKLIKAHVIPAAFFEKNGNDSAFESFLYTFDLTTHSKRLPAGIYDKELLCNDCERRFQKWDDYGANLLLTNFGNFLPVLRDSELIGWRLDDYDYRLLKMFVIGVLWRAAASDHAYFIDTTIGPFEQLAKQAVLDENPGDSDFFATVLARWQSISLPEYLRHLHTSPYKDRQDGINTLRIYMGKFILYVKVDNRQFTGSFSLFQLRNQNPLVVCARNLDVSAEFNKTNEMLLRRKGLI
jgi:hypothetical protein